MRKVKKYCELFTKKGESLIIFWEKEKFSTKDYQELTVQVNNSSHSIDITKLNRYDIKSIARSYVQNTMFGDIWFTDYEYMGAFIETLKPIIEEFNKDVEYHYSFDGWIGRVIIEPVENFIGWLKK